MQTSQQFGAASTYGKKYALGNLLLIDDTEDADASNKHGKTPTVVDKLKASMPANKPKLSGTDLAKAKVYIKGGGKVSAIQQKYELTAKQQEELAAL
jgi:hypothetical protein